MSAGELQDALRAMRARTLSLVDDLDDDQWRVPRLAVVNPFLWEVGHLGWFMEHWCLRWRGPGRALEHSLLEHADRWYDSSAVAHDTRWDLDLPARDATFDYLAAVLDRTLERLERTGDNPAALYHFQFALYHEGMHDEAFAIARHLCGYPRPRGADVPARVRRGGDVELPADRVEQGAPRDVAGFVFDNEQWSHAVELDAFAISRAPVDNGRFAAFVDDGGYRREEFWSAAGRAWRQTASAAHPAHWRRVDSQWQARSFDAWRALDPAAPIERVNAHEAEAWCRWARRRLPTEGEWEHAALAAGIEWGQVWEWTASAFLPYPGFTPGAYAEYSEPWFNSHRSLRGASTATPACNRHPRFRNFYLPERNDIVAGFRSCALS